MEQEKSSAEIAKVFSRIPKMFIIKGGQSDHISISPSPQSLHSELKKFVRINDTRTLLLNYPLNNRYNRIFKRLIDVFLSMLVIVTILSWLLPIVALLIKIDSKGPVFFLQKRNKRDGKIFICIKFRSMMENDEIDSLKDSVDEEKTTRIGRYLKKYFIDELPQFFNVLIGDMSFIGPAPHTISDNNKYEELIEYYDFRYKVKPGIVGLSQVMGYVGEAKHIQAMKNRLQLDTFYIRHWSFNLDIRITWLVMRRFFKFEFRD